LRPPPTLPRPQSLSLQFESFGALRVINEDTVAGGSGFPTHGHANANIFSYILSGALRHTDSMGNTEVLRAGDVQYTEAGTGIRHAEFNAHATEPVRFLQIWVKPWRTGLTPRYATGHFPAGAKTNALLPLLSPAVAGEEAAPKTPTLPGSLPMAADVGVYACRLEHGATVAHTFASPGRRGYVHVPIDAATKGLTVAATAGGDAAPVTLGPGDGAFIDGGLPGVAFTAATAGGAGSGDAVEFVFFDLQ
jgi:quercetin 2,3-dioxygenase